MIIRIQDDLVRYTGFRDNIEFDCKNVGDGIAQLLNMYPQLNVFLLDHDGKEAKATSVQLDGEFVWHPEVLEHRCAPTTEIIFSRKIPTGEGTGSTQRWIGAGLIIVGTLLTIFSVGTLSQIGVALIISGASMILSSLAPMPKLGSPLIEDSLDNSPSYSFGGVKNSTASGTPTPLVYGQHRCGGHILNMFTKFTAPNQPAFYQWNDAGVPRAVQYTTMNNNATSSEYEEYLYAQIGLSEGEITAVDSLEVNALPLSYYSEVDPPQIRTGTRGQEPLPWFNTIENTNSSGLLLRKAAYTVATEVTVSQEPTPSYGYVEEVDLRHLIGGRNENLSYFENFSTTNQVPPYPSSGQLAHQLASAFKVKYGNYKYTPGQVPGHWATSSGIAGIQYVHGDTPVPWVKGVDSEESRLRLRYDLRSWGIMQLYNPHNLIWDGTPNGYWQSMPPSSGAVTEITLAENAGAAVHRLTRPAQGFRVTLSAPVLYDTDSNYQQVPRTVEVTIAYREVDESAPHRPWKVAVFKDTITAKSASEVGRSYTVGETSEYGWQSPLPLAEYEVAVIRETDEASDPFKTRDTFYLKEVTELTFETLAYPHTALLGVKVKATDQLQGQPPTITSLVKGIKVAVPADRVVAGVYSRVYSGETPSPLVLASGKIWTDNPVWCLYDLLTNPRYGLGEFYKIDATKRGLMLANFYLMAKYCDTLIPCLDRDGNPVLDAGNSPTYIPRFRLNLVIDQSKPAAEWIQLICATMRASVYYSNGLFVLDIDRAKPMTQIFNMTSLKEFTTSGTSLRAIPNVYEVQFPDPEKSYTIDTFRMEDAALLADPAVEERKAALQLLGVTDRRQCQALAKYALESGRTLTKMVTFKTDRRAIYSQVGDVIGIQHDVPQWGFGGVIKEINAGTWTLSADFLPAGSIVAGAFVPEPGSSYRLRLVGADGLLSTETTFTYAPGSTGVIREIVPGALSTDPAAGPVTVLTPAPGDRYVIGTTGTVVNPFRITMLKEEQDGLFEVTCAQYNEAIYAAADDIMGAPAPELPDYSLLVPVTRDAVTGVSARVKTYLDSAGVLKNGIEVFYSPPYHRANWAGCTLHYALSGSSLFTELPLSASGYFWIPEAADGDYLLILPSTWKDGAAQTRAEALNDSDSLPYTRISVAFLQEIIDAPEVDWEIRGLQIENAGNSDEFVGKDCIVTWRRPRLLDQNAAAGDEGGQDTGSWILGYTVEILNPDGTMRRSTVTTTERYLYSSEMNHQDGVSRSFLVRVTTIGAGNHFSAPATIGVNNPSPAAVSGVVATGGVREYKVSFPPAVELDLVGYKIYVSGTAADLNSANGEEISTAFLVHQGPETNFSSYMEAGTFYLKVAAYDSFGEGGLHYSPLYSFIVEEELPHLLATLEGEILASHLATSLLERIDATDSGVIGTISGFETDLAALQAQYTVKIDNNGFVSGFGLASEVVNGEPFSEFIINADRTAIISKEQTPLAVASADRTDTTLTVTTTLAHGLNPGDYCLFSGAAQYPYNGTWKVATVPSPTQVAITLPAAVGATPATAASGMALQLWKVQVPFIVDGTTTYIDTALIKELTADKISSGEITSKILTLSSGVDGACGLFSGRTGFGQTTPGFALGVDTTGNTRLEIGDINKSLTWDTAAGELEITGGTVTGSTITGGTITGTTITGGVINTASTGGKRIEVSSVTNTIKGYNADGTNTVTIDSDYGVAGDKTTCLQIYSSTSDITQRRAAEFITKKVFLEGYTTFQEGIRATVDGGRFDNINSQVNGTGVVGRVSASQYGVGGFFEVVSGGSGTGVYAFVSDVVTYATGVKINTAGTTSADGLRSTITSTGSAYGVYNSVTGLSGSTSVYGVYSVVDGGTSGYEFYAAGTRANYGPFTGSHDALVAKDFVADTGDIVCDLHVIKKAGVSSTLTEIGVSWAGSRPIGVLNYVDDFGRNVPACLLHKENPEVPGTDFEALMSEYRVACFNALGEGQINVCKDGGNISAGDYICASSRPGKGMKQDDDLLHNYTVAKAREDCVWAEGEDDIRMIACTYHCG